MKMSTATNGIQLPWTQRVNWRLWLVLAVAALLVGYPVYQFLEVAVTGGVRESTDAKGDLLQVDLKAMSLFDMHQQRAVDQDIPAKWRALDGKRVALVGEMYVGTQAAGKQSDFDLCYSIAKCCFSGPPQVQHFVKCSVVKGVKAEAYSDQVTVKGTMHVGVERDPETDTILSVYRLDVESVRPN
jgi:hypothetical protein